ncbi:MAG: TrkA family potassium uptake protein [Clostridia bacterium]
MSKYEKNQFAVIGLGQFGQALAIKLSELGKDVLVIDRNEQLINDISPKVTHAIVADAEDEQVLRSVGISNFDVVCVCMSSNMEANILITLMAKEMGVPYVVSKASTERHKHVLQKIGADLVVFPEDNMGKKLATQLLNPLITDITDISTTFKIVELHCPDLWVNKKVAEIDIRKTFGLSIIVIKRSSNAINPDASTVILQEDTLVLGGDVEGFDRLTKKLF